MILIIKWQKDKDLTLAICMIDDENCQDFNKKETDIKHIYFLVCFIIVFCEIFEMLYDFFGTFSLWSYAYYVLMNLSILFGLT